MNNKGLTLVELLAVIVIIAILGGITALSYNYIITKGKNGVYTNYESNLIGGAELYLIDNIDKLPSENSKISITYQTLKDNNYIDEFKDPNGKDCSNSYVVIKRNNDVGNNYDLEYYACLMCSNYISDNEYCNN